MMCESTGQSRIQEPKIVDFGPYRVIGMNYIGKNENQEIVALWGAENGFVSRINEIKTLAEGASISFGICRCVPGVTDGSFEYIAGLPAPNDAPVPDGMIEASIGQGKYAVFVVPSLTEISRVWGETQTWLSSSNEWVGTCGPDKCECAQYPFFELYPANFTPESELYIYVPVRPK